MPSRARSTSGLVRFFLAALVVVGLVGAMPSRAPAVAQAQAASHARRHRLTAAERRRMERLHRRATPIALRHWLELAPRPLVLVPVGRNARIVLTPTNDEGHFDEASVVAAEQALAYRHDGSTHPVHPRLLDLVYQAQLRFRVPYVHVVSGYRPQNPRSRHAQGRAMDIVLPGLPDRRLAAHFRTQGFVGVGIYPQSRFVHVDVRARSFFWSDSSLPDQPSRERPILRTLGARYDRAARARGVLPTEELGHAHDEDGELTSGDLVGDETSDADREEVLEERLVASPDGGT